MGSLKFCMGVFLDMFYKYRRNKSYRLHLCWVYELTTFLSFFTQYRYVQYRIFRQFVTMYDTVK